MAQELQISDFDYELPSELIAQKPCVRREDARLLVLNRVTQEIRHHRVDELPAILQPRDLLVFNNSRVLPARLYGIRSKTGGKWEGLFLREHSASNTPSLELLAQTRGYVEPGEWIELLDREHNRSPYRIQVVGRTIDRHLLVGLPGKTGIYELLEAIGHVPLPQYVRRGVDTPDDRTRYQTVFASEPGSIAAPTAGLHFTPELLNALSNNLIEKAYVTLHVGIGTFAPIKTMNLNEHIMHEEYWEVSEKAAAAINHRHGRCIAVGTTTVRTLETAALEHGFEDNTGKVILPACTGMSSLFIRPGFNFQVIDGLLTNFHLPRSTLLVLISALAGRELIRHAYAEAIQHRYRFFSYGDAMLIL